MSGLGLLVLTATVAADPCAALHPAITAFTDGDALIFAAVPEGSPLLEGGSEAFEVWPLPAGIDLEAAKGMAADRKLSCGPPVVIAKSRIVSPVDRSPLVATELVPVMAPERGKTDRGPLAVERLASVIDHSTAHKEAESVLSVSIEPLLAPTPGGAALVARSWTPALGEIGRRFGPVVRLGVEAPPVPSRVAPEDAGEMRDALDLKDGMKPGEVWSATLPGYGAIDRTLELPKVSLDDPGSPVERFFLAHGLAFGLPLVSFGFGFFGTARCVVMCEELVFPFDRAYRDEFNARDPESIEDARTRLYILEGVTFAVAGLAMLAPSDRHGNLSRPEILEDILIIGEGAMVALTTPSLFRNRIGRNRPLSFHPILGPKTEGSVRVGPPFMAFSPNYAGGLMGAATTLLVIEDAPAPYVWATALGLTGLGVWLAITEIDAGLAFPSDAPLSFLYGAINGAGVALWHQIFWRGWPGNERGDLPLRLQGASLIVDESGAQLGVGGAF